ncbi:MAG: hypothetical protein ACNA7V_12045 [Bacteroidales bacterium]
MYKLTTLVLPLLVIILFNGCTDDNDPVDLIDDRDAFIGTWNVNETCSKDAYTVTITKDPGNSSQVLIGNFWHVPFCQDLPYAIIAGKSMVIPQQSFCSNAFDVGGSGTLSKNKLTLSYTVSDGADEYKCTAFYEKQ